MATIFMLAPAPDMVFGPMPSGSSYQANQHGLIFTSSSADQVALMQDGCQTLTPFSAYQLPPFTAWKLGATGCFASTANVLNDVIYVNKSTMSVRMHFTTCQWSGAVILAYCNWANQPAVGDYWDTGTTGFGTIAGTCSIAYPNKNNIVGTGTFTIAPGQTAQVLVNLNTAIPPGVKVWIGTYAAPGSGCGIPLFSASYDVGADSTGSYSYNYNAGEAAECATSGITDKTSNLSTVGNAPGPSAVSIWGPTAILALQPVTQPVITLWGDSKEYGLYVEPDPYGNLGPIAQAFGITAPAISFGADGKNAGTDAGTIINPCPQQGLSAMFLRLQLAQLIGATHAITDIGRNDAASLSAPTIEASITTIGKNQAGIGLVPWLVTQPPNTSSTDGWITTGNQTILTPYGATLDAVNAWERATPAPFVGTIDACAAVATAPTAGVWQPNWTPDGIHWSANAVSAVLSAVPLNRFAGSISPYAVAYADTYNRGIKNTQSALDFLLNPTNLGHDVLLGSLLGANFNTTSDQAIGLVGPPAFVITDIVVCNPSSSLSAAQGAFYAASSKAAPLLGTTTTTVFSGLTDSPPLTGLIQAIRLSLPSSGMSYKMAGSQTVYLSLTTAQGAAATADIYVFGKRLSV